MKKQVLLWMVLLIAFCAEAQEEKKGKKKSRKYQHEEVDFEGMMRRYFLKEQSNALEGIYSVSCVITKKSKVFLSKREKVRIVEKHDNYARVAILKDLPSSKRDFIEVSLSYHDAKKYPIVGSLDGLSEGNGFVYKHIEPDGTIISFSMLSESSDLLEGEYSKIERRKTITYQLSYLKIFPKEQELVIINK